jgi:hypothetical protein
MIKEQTSALSGGHYISRRLSYSDVLYWASLTWGGQKQVAESVAIEATRLICEAYEENPAFFGNKSKKWILGGLFYLLGHKYGEPRTQKQIAHTLNTNEVTVRNSIQNWRTRFERFFLKKHRWDGLLFWTNLMLSY